MTTPRFQVRPDITPDVVHFTKGDSVADAYSVLEKILFEKCLLGGTGFIRGGTPCICFTEAPLKHLCEIFWWTANERLRYKPFGVMTSKQWLFERGGRPVIYQSDVEYDALPEDLRYRHVRYEPSSDPPIDFTWEREWRLRADRLELDPDDVRVVVPNGDYIDALKRAHDREQDALVEEYSIIFGRELARMHRHEFPWTVINLADLRTE